MLNLNVEHSQWLIIAMLGGIFFVLIIIVTYLDMWKPRNEEEFNWKPDEEKSIKEKIITIWRAIPWILKITYALSIIFSLVYGIYRIINPPNW